MDETSNLDNEKRGGKASVEIFHLKSGRDGITTKESAKDHYSRGRLKGTMMLQGVEKAGNERHGDEKGKNT